MDEKNRSRELIRRLKNDDINTFELIYAEHYKRLYNFARDYVIDHEETSDILQNVFTKLWNNRKKLDDDSRISAWLITITRNECLSLINHRKIVKEKKQDIYLRKLEINYRALSDMDVSSHTFFDISDIIKETINKLPPQCRKVFELSRYRNMSNKNIARELSVSVKTVESHITRSLKMLREALADYL